MNERPIDDDEQLVKRIAANDRQALSELYMRYQQPLFTYMLQLTPDYGLAEELLQDTLVAIWKSAGSFEGRSSVRTWLIGIARRQAHNTLRQHKLPCVAESELEELAATEPEPEELALASVARDELVAAFYQLAPVHREILVLTFVYELSYQEAAQILCVPVGTVMLVVTFGCLAAMLSSRNLQEASFAAIVLPGIVFISAFSIACTAILWVPLYQFLFVACWFWGNILPTRFGIPTLSNTILTPVGSYMSAGFFGIPDFQVTSSTTLQAVESMILLVVLAVFAIVALLGYLKWEQGRL